MWRKLTATVLAFRAVLMIGHGIVWLFVGQSAPNSSSIVGSASSIISMISMAGGMFLMTLAYLATRRGKAELAADNAALDANGDAVAGGGFDPDAALNRYLANQAAARQLEDAGDAHPTPVAEPVLSHARAAVPVMERPITPARPTFGRKAA
jgi:Zn-dependent protease with chaperone function